MDARPIFVAVCYFPLDTFSYAHYVLTKGHSPYETLHDGVMKFSKLGDFFLLGYFNPRTSDAQVGLLNFEEDPIIVPEIDPIENGTTQQHSEDAPLVQVMEPFTRVWGSS